MKQRKIGYHESKIPKGEIGYLTKIMEEYHELIDASNQGCAVMEILELSDLVGAIEAYATKNWDITIFDLKEMADITARAFRAGERTEKK